MLKPSSIIRKKTHEIPIECEKVNIFKKTCSPVKPPKGLDFSGLEGIFLLTKWIEENYTLNLIVDGKYVDETHGFNSGTLKYDKKSFIEDSLRVKYVR